jgi:hypothetical protein
MPPTLFVKDTGSLGEQIQRTFPETKMVKALISAVDLVAKAGAGRLGAAVVAEPGREGLRGLST